MPVGCFTRQQRLVSPSQFKHTFKSGRRIGDQSMTLIFIANDKPFARLGLAIPKKAVKRAVDRNRLKRVIRESFREHQEIIAGNDIVVLIKRDLSSQTNAAMFAKLKEYWQTVEKQCEQS